MRRPEPSPQSPERPQPLAAEIVQALDTAACPPEPGDVALLSRVRGRVLRVVQEEVTGHRTVRAQEGGWVQVAPGFERKVLHESGCTISSLVRLAPGTFVAGHAHPVDEECLVLEGTLRIGSSLLLQAGDFHLGRQGRLHEGASTDTGVLLYLRGAVPSAEAAAA